MHKPVQSAQRAPTQTPQTGSCTGCSANPLGLTAQAPYRSVQRPEVVCGHPNCQGFLKVLGHVHLACMYSCLPVCVAVCSGLWSGIPITAEELFSAGPGGHLQLQRPCTQMGS